MFKKGDKVICVKNGSFEIAGDRLSSPQKELQVGKEYTVAQDSTEFNVDIEFRDSNHTYYPQRFELAKPKWQPKFKKGDRVVVVDPIGTYMQPGDFATVTGDDDGKFIEVKFDNPETQSESWCTTRFALVTAPAVESLTIKQIRAIMEENDQLKAKVTNLQVQIANAIDALASDLFVKV